LSAQPQPQVQEGPIIDIRRLSVFYGENEAVKRVDMGVPPRSISAIIGPSGCGKSTLLRSINRMNDFIADVRVEGEILYRGLNLYARDVDAVDVRRRIGMVFQKPNPFPKSIYMNVVWGPKINGYRGDLRELAETSLRQAALWDEVKDRLKESALALSGGQQQRLCIARAISMQPEVILLDEPASALDPISTARIEELLLELKQRYAIVIVTHNMQQAARLSDLTAFMYQGVLVEHDDTKTMFTRPRLQQTQDYITGRFG
jgi:phosphate transport system ATP-binding protein